MAPMTHPLTTYKSARDSWEKKKTTFPEGIDMCTSPDSVSAIVCGGWSTTGRCVHLTLVSPLLRHLSIRFLLLSVPKHRLQVFRIGKMECGWKKEWRSQDINYLPSHPSIGSTQCFRVLSWGFFRNRRYFQVTFVSSSNFNNFTYSVWSIICDIRIIIYIII